MYHASRKVRRQKRLTLHQATGSVMERGRSYVIRFAAGLFVCANLALLSSCNEQQDSSKSASEAITKALQLYEHGQLDAARTEVSAAIKAEPKSSEAHILAGRIAEKSGDLNSAVSEYAVAGSSKGRLAAAALLIKARAYSVAEEWIAKCLATFPNDSAMKGYRALLAERQGNSRKAQADAEAILAENKGDVIANAVLAEQALNRKDSSYALTLIDAGLATDPADERLLRLKAQALAERNLPDQAVAVYKGLISTDPTAPDNRKALAELLAKKDVAQAEGELRDGVQAAPGSIEMRMPLVLFLAQHGSEKDVEAELRSAIAASPNTTAYDIALANVYLRADGFDAAEKTLSEAIDRAEAAKPRSAAQLALARLYIAKGDLDKAQSVLSKVSEAKTDDDDVLAVRGQLLLRQRNPVAAVQDFLLLASHQPANPAVFISLAQAFFV
jgi:Tfp pilus assembly protein PilF